MKLMLKVAVMRLFQDASRMKMKKKLTCVVTFVKHHLLACSTVQQVNQNVLDMSQDKATVADVISQFGITPQYVQVKCPKLVNKRGIKSPTAGLLSIRNLYHKFGERFLEKILL